MTEIKKKLLSIWGTTGLDIRQTGNGRWYDQKVTPDIMAMICDVIVTYHGDNNTDSFTIKDLWYSPAFKKSMRKDFGKPEPSNPGSGSEYGKVIGQPLNVLCAAGILKSDRKRQKEFQINSEFVKFLHKLADSERDAVKFLAFYIEQVLRQSGLDGMFNRFFAQQDKSSFATIKGGFSNFMIKYTNINTEVECNRIFSKVLNIQAHVRNKLGAERGSLSRDAISLNEIRYNRINFRDRASQKPKHIPRQQQNSNVVTRIDNATADQSRTVQRTIKDVKVYHSYASEIQNQYATTPANTFSVQGHHIFPRSQYKSLACVRENIIVLSATQHTGQAHESAHTVSERYQQLCLLKKLDAIEACEKNPNCNFYSFRSFKNMLAVVGILNSNNGGGNVQALRHLTYDDVREIILDHYRSAQ